MNSVRRVSQLTRPRPGFGQLRRCFQPAPPQPAASAIVTPPELHHAFRPSWIPASPCPPRLAFVRQLYAGEKNQGRRRGPGLQRRGRQTRVVRRRRQENPRPLLLRASGGCQNRPAATRRHRKLGSRASVVGVSGDTPESHRLFKKEHKLTFTLLADTKGDVAKKFGVPVNKGSTNKAKVDGKEVEIPREVNINRYTVVIDKKGNVAAIDAVKDAGGDPKRIAEIVKGLDSK